LALDHPRILAASVAVKAVFISYAFPPQAAPRAVQVARLATFSALPIRVVCAGASDNGFQPRPGVDVVRFPDASSPWWRLVKRFIYLPDSERPWADQLARSILSQRLIDTDDVLITFGQPMSDHLAGLALKRALGIPWIAHFSDPWSDNPYGWPNPLSRLKLRTMEESVIAAADRVLFTSQETVDLVMGKYPQAWRAKAGTMPHAFDPHGLAGEIRSATTGTTLVLRHLGNFYGRRNPLLLIQALKLLLQKQPATLDCVRFELIGRWVGHENPSPTGFGLPDGLVRFRKSIPYIDSLREMRDASALLIIDAPFEQNVFFPSKLVDYLWARRPILALTPPGTTANIVSDAGGSIVSPQNPESIAAGVADFLARLRTGQIGASREEIIVRYDARLVAREFDDLVMSLSRDAASRRAQPCEVVH
jgi:glycosyltransferase involved in cell wall biosynthesis